MVCGFGKVKNKWGDVHPVFFFLPSYIDQLMVNCWFGARWFGFLGSPYERDCYWRAPLESQTINMNVCRPSRPRASCCQLVPFLRWTGEVDPVLQPSYVTGMELILFLKRNPKQFWKILDFFWNLTIDSWLLAGIKDWNKKPEESVLEK